MVFLHGLGCDRGQFAGQWQGLNPGLRLLSLDLPGHGDSPESPTGAYTVQSMADAVLDELRVRKLRGVVLVGHSAGGLVALDIAVAHPDLVSGVLLIDSNMALTAADRRVNRRRAEESETGDWRRHYMASMRDSWGPDDEAGDACLRAEVLRTLERASERVVRPFWHDILAFDPVDLCRRCPAPMLYVRSRRDTDLTVLRSLNPLISVVDLRPNCHGHWPHLQRPDLVNGIFHEFVAGLPKDG
ncbi:alpha/beta hydrolase [Nonomuraea sp. NPDC005501]|uniref:alpha/beta fold hydrolase n=1 Tax=Nonomuraea sp. NPDC005501 TaxID=3156884 RepID=UPI0033A9F1B4